jgi:hypothetical protein
MRIILPFDKCGSPKLHILNTVRIEATTTMTDFNTNVIFEGIVTSNSSTVDSPNSTGAVNMAFNSDDGTSGGTTTKIGKQLENRFASLEERIAGLEESNMATKEDIKGLKECIANMATKEDIKALEERLMEFLQPKSTEAIVDHNNNDTTGAIPTAGTTDNTIEVSGANNSNDPIDVTNLTEVINVTGEYKWWD